jgi:hypothetical protein
MGINYHLLWLKDRTRVRGRWMGAAESQLAPQSRGRKGGGRKEKGAPTSGAGVSAAQKKKKKEGGELCRRRRELMGRQAGWAKR